MRFLLYANLIAIMLLAGSLARLYEGERLPWLEHRQENAVAELPAPETGDEGSVPAPAAHEPSSPLTLEQIMALQLPLPNPERAPAEAEAVAKFVPEPEPRREIVILTEGAYPPFNYRDGSDALAGFDVELSRALCERMKVRCAWAVLVIIISFPPVITSLYILPLGLTMHAARASMHVSSSYPGGGTLYTCILLRLLLLSSRPKMRTGCGIARL